MLRYVFYLVGMGAVPLGLSMLLVWLLTPPPDAGTVGGLRRIVEAQPIPFGIVLFTLFALILWRYRYDLPFAGAIGVSGRRDIPARARARFEEAGALLDEARRILRTQKKGIGRELTQSERDQVDTALKALDEVMETEPFDVSAFDDAHSRADRIVGEHLSRWRKSELREYAESIGIAIAVALLLRAAVVEAFKIPSGSMIPTLMIGDHIFVNKLTYGPLVPYSDRRLWTDLPPKRGDVAVFKFPENKDQDFIKRIVAIPGDTLEAVDGRPVLNGWLVPNCHVGSYDYSGRRAEIYLEYLGEYAYLTLYDTLLDDTPCESSRDCKSAKSCLAGVCGLHQGPFKVKDDEVWVMGDNRNNSHDSRSWRSGLGAGVPFENIKGRAMFVWVSFGPGGGIATDRLMVNVMGRPMLPASHTHLQPALDHCLASRPSLAETTPPGPNR